MTLMLSAARLDARHVGEHIERGLGGGVRGQAGDSHLGDHRVDVDDHPAAVFAHHGNGGLHRNQWAKDIEIDDLAEVIQADIRDFAECRLPGVVD